VGSHAPGAAGVFGSSFENDGTGVRVEPVSPSLDDDGEGKSVGLGGCAGRRESRARSTAAGLSERVVAGVVGSLDENWSSDSVSGILRVPFRDG
jgi:hypothetical protein